MQQDLKEIRSAIMRCSQSRKLQERSLSHWVPPWHRGVLKLQLPVLPCGVKYCASLFVGLVGEQAQHSSRQINKNCSLVPLLPFIPHLFWKKLVITRSSPASPRT